MAGSCRFCQVAAFKSLKTLLKFRVGGYQLCAKWLKDRKGRMLTYDDLLHYERVCAALAETAQQMSAIDAVIEEHGGFPLS